MRAGGKGAGRWEQRGREMGVGSRGGGRWRQGEGDGSRGGGGGQRGGRLETIPPCHSSLKCALVLASVGAGTSIFRIHRFASIGASPMDAKCVGACSDGCENL
jgi:hypothetical protein